MIAGITDLSNEEPNDEVPTSEPSSEPSSSPTGPSCTDSSSNGEVAIALEQPFCKKTGGRPPSVDAFDCSVFKSIKEKFYGRVNEVIESDDESQNFFLKDKGIDTS